MTAFWIFLLILICIALLFQIRSAFQRMEGLEERLRYLEDDVHRLESAGDRRTTKSPESTPRINLPPPLPQASPPKRPMQPTPAPMGTVLPLPPSIPIEIAPPIYARAVVPPVITAPEPAPPPAPQPVAATVPAPQAEGQQIQWESFLGVKLFAWIAGLALFLAAVFFVKHAFEHDYITPRMRVLIGGATGLGLIAGGLWMPRARHIVTVHTLCATGILVLYADCFAAHAYYPFLDVTPAFALMTLITAAAFALAVRLDAQVIAVLGLLGGFLTPPLLSKGVDRAAELFGYLALLDAGLIAIALRKRWNYLVALAAAATVFMQWSWVGKFFEPGKVYIAMTIFLGFAVMFVGAFGAARWRKLADPWTASAAFLMPAMASLFALWLVIRPHAEIANRPGLLFGFVALVDVLFLALAGIRPGRKFPVLLAALSTMLTQWIWVAGFFEGAKLHAGMAVFLGFAVLFAGVFAAAHARRMADGWMAGAALLMPATALLFALYVVARAYPVILSNASIFFGYVFVVDLLVLALAWLREELRPSHVGTGAGVFLVLAVWTAHFLSDETLNLALGAYLLFAVLHSVYPIVLQRLKPSSMTVFWVHLYPVLALLLVLFPLAKLAAASLLVWPVVLIIDLVAIVMAVLTASLMAILAVFVLTVLATALWITQLPPTMAEVPSMLVIIGGFAVFFMAASVLAARKVFTKLTPAEGGDVTAGSGVPVLTQQMFSQVCSLAGLMPYLLLTLVVMRLPLTNPTPVFAVGAGLLVLKLAMARMFKIDLLPAVGLAGVLLLNFTWHFAHYTPERAAQAVGWYLGFSGLIMGFPFLFRRDFENRVIPWAAAALALPLHYLIIHRAIKEAAPEFGTMGLVPAALAVPCLLGLLRLLRPAAAEAKAREAQFALFGAAALFFITLVIPTQFDRQWITVGWALEGSALLWLFHRVPHPGLRAVGVALLVTAFARLALNPWVYTGYGRTGIPIWNWYLYAYGIVTVCLLAGGWLLLPPRDRVAGVPMPPLLYTLGAVLAFLLLNVEIADSFSPPGEGLTFRFSANFGQDMTYSLGWALFAFGMLAIGFRLKNAPSRYAGMALLIVTLLKLFLHDVWRLGGMFRIGSLFGLAVVLLVVSLIYQRFLSAESARKT